MDFVLPSNVNASLQRVPTPWGRLVGLRHDRITQTILADGQYEWAETAIVGQLLRAGAVAVDVGANIGYYTALFQLLVGSKGQVHSFEANPFTAALLALARSENGWELVRVNNLAVGAADGTMTVKPLDLDRLGDDINLGGWMLRESAEGWRIDVTTLDKYVADRKLEKLHFMKVDVEGFELNVLNGADTSIRKFKPYILMEMRSESEEDRARCEQMTEFLTSRDFAACRIMKRPFPHFRPIVPADLAGLYHFNLIAMPRARYRDYRESLGG
jgi:FkbM family methyltransferase